MTHDFPKMLLYFKDPIDKDKKKKYLTLVTSLYDHFRCIFHLPPYLFLFQINISIFFFYFFSFNSINLCGTVDQHSKAFLHKENGTFRNFIFI